MPQTRKLGHIVLKVRDAQKSKEFYTRALGLRVAYEDAGYANLPGLLAWRIRGLFDAGRWPTPAVVRLDNDAAIGRGNDGGRIFRNGAFGIAKEGKAKKAEGDQGSPENGPMERDCEHAEKKRRDAEEVAFFDHA